MNSFVFSCMNSLCLCLVYYSTLVATESFADYVGTDESSTSTICELPSTFNSYENLFEFAKNQHVGTQLTNITCKGTTLWILIRNLSAGDYFEELSIHTWDGTRSLTGSSNGYRRILFIPFRDCYFSVEKTKKESVRVFEHMGTSSNRRIVFEIYNVVGCKWCRDDFIKDRKPLKDKSLYRMHPVLLPSLPLRKKFPPGTSAGHRGASGAPLNNRHLRTCITNSVLKSSADLQTGN